MKGPPERGGSIWPAFADAYGKPVLLANLAVSGASITLWNSPGQRQKVRAALEALRRAGYEPTIVWMNGETDAAAGMSARDYYRRLRLLAADTGPVRWFITRESRCYAHGAKYRPLDEARDRFAAEEPNLRRIGPDLDHITDAMRVSDRCHLARQGQLEFGREMGQAFAAAWPEREL